MFDGVDPVQQQAIRRALEKELRSKVAHELEEEIRRKVEREVRQETRDAVLREIADRAPTAEERERFSAYVGEVRLDAYAQATLASEIADRADAALAASRRVTSPLLTSVLVVFPLVAFYASKLLAESSGLFVAVMSTAALAYLAAVVSSTRRERRLEAQSSEHRKIASSFLILTERAKAYAMVHAERLVSSRELLEVLEELRRAKERQDKDFHPGAAELADAKERVGPRIAAESLQRIADDARESDLEAEPPLEPRAARARRR